MFQINVLCFRHMYCVLHLWATVHHPPTNKVVTTCLYKYQVHKNGNGRLLLHNYKPCDHVGKICDRNEDIGIDLRINGSKIECIELESEE